MTITTITVAQAKTLLRSVPVWMPIALCAPSIYAYSTMRSIWGFCAESAENVICLCPQTRCTVKMLALGTVRHSAQYMKYGTWQVLFTIGKVKWCFIWRKYIIKMTPIDIRSAHVLHTNGMRLHAKFCRLMSRNFRGVSKQTRRSTLKLLQDMCNSTTTNFTLIFFRWNRVPSVFWCCWLGNRKGTWPVKIQWWSDGVVICLRQGADLNMAQFMLLPFTVSCCSKIRIGLSFWYWLTQVVPDKGPLNECCCCCWCCQVKLGQPVTSVFFHHLLPLAT